MVAGSDATGIGQALDIYRSPRAARAEAGSDARARRCPRDRPCRETIAGLDHQPPQMRASSAKDASMIRISTSLLVALILFSASVAHTVAAGWSPEAAARYLDSRQKAW